MTFISIGVCLFLQVILTPEQQERMRLNKERALAKRKATQDKRAEQLAQNELTNTQTCETGKFLQIGQFSFRCTYLNTVDGENSCFESFLLKYRRMNDVMIQRS